jgi:hypothetical protein
MIVQGIEYTQQARQYAEIAMDVYKTYKDGKIPTQEEFIARAKQEALARGKKELAKQETALFNMGSKFAMDRLPKQLSFLKDKQEMARVTGLLNQTDLITSRIPGLPALKDTIPNDVLPEGLPAALPGAVRSL